MSETTNNRPITSPLTHRVRILRHRVVPAAVWLCSIVLLLVWEGGRSQYLVGVGIVEARQTVVSPIVDGNLQSLAVDIFDEIEVGQILAMMDDTVIVAELVVAEAEMARLHSKVLAESRRLDSDLAQQEADALNDLRRFQMNEEEAQLQYLEMVVRQESDTIKLERLRIQMARQRDLVDQDVAAEELYDDTRPRHEQLKKELEENESALEAAKQLLEQSTQRRSEWESQSLVVDSDDFLGPIREALNVQEARISEIKQRRAMLALSAPVGGQVVHIFHRPGETVLAGDPIMAIADTGYQRVLAYVDERSAGEIQSGDEARLQSEHRPDRIIVGRVESAGAAIQELPIALRKTPIFPEWGFPVLISGIPQGVFLPGERLRVRIKTGQGETSGGSFADSGGDRARTARPPR